MDNGGVGAGSGVVEGVVGVLLVGGWMGGMLVKHMFIQVNQLFCECPSTTLASHATLQI